MVMRARRTGILIHTRICPVGGSGALS